MNVLVAMSGGVDSSVAAKILTDAGCSCIGCTMKLYGNGELGLSNMHTCCSIDDTEDARSVAYQLKMRYYVFNFSDGFREKVMLPFADGYMHGLTPNPCIDCNRYMKFEKDTRLRLYRDRTLRPYRAKWGPLCSQESAR